MCCSAFERVATSEERKVYLYQDTGQSNTVTEQLSGGDRGSESIDARQRAVYIEIEDVSRLARGSIEEMQGE